MIGSVSSGFADLVTIGERLEEGIKKGKITVAETSNGAKTSYGNFQKKKGAKLILFQLKRNLVTDNNNMFNHM